MKYILVHEIRVENKPLTPSAPLDASIVQRLQRFGTYGKLKQAALKKVAVYIARDPILFKGTLIVD